MVTTKTRRTRVRSPWSEMTERERIAIGFRILRKRGIGARMAFACCSTCGHYELDKKHARYVFWNKQSETRSFRDGRLVSELFIQFSDATAGRHLAQVMRECGLTVDWDGSEFTCVSIVPDKK